MDIVSSRIEWLINDGLQSDSSDDQKESLLLLDALTGMIHLRPSFYIDRMEEVEMLCTVY